MENNFTYTERIFSSSIETIKDEYEKGRSVKEISESTNLSEYLVKALIDRYVIKWDNYSGMPAPEFYKDEY